MPGSETLLWIGFGLAVLVMFALDLGLSQRHAHEVRFREALGWTVGWICLAGLFNLFVYRRYGDHTKALEFLTGYLIELSLSVDNLFVFLLVFSYFRVSGEYQRKVLFWGIVGAIVMRGVFIWAGLTLMHRFAWVIYVFGVFLVYTGLKMAFHREKEVHPEKNPVLRLLRRFVPITPSYHGGAFFVRREGRLLATPLLVVLLVMETTDIVFAVDSIPAIMGITSDPFIIFTSNIFAVLGLRSMYFVLAGFMRLFHYLNYGLSLVLVFIGAKMLVGHYHKIPVQYALGTIATILAITVVLSVMLPKPADPVAPLEG